MNPKERADGKPSAFDMQRLTAGDTIEGVISDFGMNGEGVLKVGAYPVFVPFAIVGEKVRAKVNYAKKDCAFADLIEVLMPSNSRVKPRCPYFGRCGGCDLQHIEPALQEEIKREQLIRVMRKNAGLDVVPDEVVSGGMWGYRNKLALPFGRMGRQGKVVLGFYEKRSHRVVPMRFCPLHGKWAEELIADVSEWANENDVSVYDERTGKGLLRHLVARELGSLSVTLSVNGESVPRLSNLVKKLDRHFSGYTVWLSPQTEKNNVILGGSVKLVHGKESAAQLGAFRAVVSPLSFLQVNDEIREKLYAAACEAVGDADAVTELYSGVGLLTADIALRLPRAKITSVEIVEDAARDARRLMDRLGLSDRVTVVTADAAEHMRSSFGRERADAVLVDPPRKGCSPEVIDAVVASGCRRLVYISCNPATLSRDIALLMKGGFGLVRLTPFDMFPETMNLETLAVLERERVVGGAEGDEK